MHLNICQVWFEKLKLGNVFEVICSEKKNVLFVRYRDIAPRNYGGEDVAQPPRYSSHPTLPPEPHPSSDYERPPPYYYPGPPDN